MSLKGVTVRHFKGLTLEFLILLYILTIVNLRFNKCDFLQLLFADTPEITHLLEREGGLSCKIFAIVVHACRLRKEGLGPL